MFLPLQYSPEERGSERSDFNFNASCEFLGATAFYKKVLGPLVQRLKLHRLRPSRKLSISESHIWCPSRNGLAFFRLMRLVEVDPCLTHLLGLMKKNMNKYPICKIFYFGSQICYRVLASRTPLVNLARLL